MELSRNDFVGKTQGYITFGIDPLNGKNLWDNVAASSPCIGKYKLTCLQINSVLLTCGLCALLCQTLVVLAGRFLFWSSLVCSPSSWCSCVGCVELLLRGMCWIAPLWLYCISPSWLYCVAPSWAVLILCRLCCIITLWALSRAVRFSRWGKGSSTLVPVCLLLDPSQVSD